YHWDLPEVLESKGGWTNRDIVSWFSEYAEICSRAFGDRVKNWMVMNEPMGFVGAGYFLGVHAPGRKGLKNFLPATHHAVLAMAAGGRIIRENVPQANIGSTFSCSYVEPYSGKPRDYEASLRVDALLNRLVLEPALGLGYPVRELPVLKKMEKYIQSGDHERMAFELDFIGLQNYTREVVRHSLFMPYLHAKLVKAENRQVPITAMKWEVYPESIYSMIKKFDRYPKVKKIIITENGAAFPDQVTGKEVHDPERIKFIQEYLQQVLRAKTEGCKVDGYFIWSLTDNFEWAEGYHPRFGLVYVDFDTQQRIVKSSGKWYRDFLKG
ncbi:MAG TPA: family 1 glycosylhydrolase, partial [Sphingobacteriaceae bacterium]